MDVSLLEEVAIGVLSLILLTLTIALSYYVYRHRLTVTVEERDARAAAVGLSLFFGALAARSVESWWHSVALRLDWWQVPGSSSPVMYVLVLSFALLGAILALRAFYPWPFWFTLFLISLLIPVALVFV